MGIFFSTWICKSTQFVLSGSTFIHSSLYPRRAENNWSVLESNAGTLASQATALTTRPWLLGHVASLNMQVRNARYVGEESKLSTIQQSLLGSTAKLQFVIIIKFVMALKGDVLRFRA